MTHSIGCDAELAKSKPDPQIYDLARQRFGDGAEAGQCLVFEDAPNGVEAGLAAGMQVLSVTLTHECLVTAKFNTLFPHVSLSIMKLHCLIEIICFASTKL